MESLWNSVVWEAISELGHFCMDEVFFDCEKKLHLLGAPYKEIDLRLFALALYCQKSHPADFYETAAFTRFGDALNLLSFERIARKLIEENNIALVVYWAVLRCSPANSMPQKAYSALENEMMVKSLELGMVKK